MSSGAYAPLFLFVINDLTRSVVRDIMWVGRQIQMEVVEMRYYKVRFDFIYKNDPATLGDMYLNPYDEGLLRISISPTEGWEDKKEWDKGWEVTVSNQKGLYLKDIFTLLLNEGELDAGLGGWYFFIKGHKFGVGKTPAEAIEDFTKRFKEQMEIYKSKWGRIPPDWLDGEKKVTYQAA